MEKVRDQAATLDYLKILVRAYYDIQGQRERSEHRLKYVKNPIDVEFLQDLIVRRCKKQEKDLKKEIERTLEEFPVWTEYLSKIRGYGPILAGGEIAETYPISRFDSPSKLWAYHGVSVGYVLVRCTRSSKAHRFIMTSMPDYTCPRKLKGGNDICGEKFELIEEHPTEIPRRMAGYGCNWNTFLQTHVFRTGSCFRRDRSNGFYKQLYFKIKDEYKLKKPSPSNASKKQLERWHSHINQMALRKTVKIFLQHYWVVARILDGLPTGKPYIIEHGGHANYIPPMIDTDEGPIEWEATKEFSN